MTAITGVPKKRDFRLLGWDHVAFTRDPGDPWAVLEFMAISSYLRKSAGKCIAFSDHARSRCDHGDSGDLCSHTPYPSSPNLNDFQRVPCSYGIRGDFMPILAKHTKNFTMVADADEIFECTALNPGE